ncbi:hypothetical protein G3567_03390 [Psychroflexus sp. YR1-1]|uniref:Secreted protein n=1 Tax=Psychroflexus aurantiacus TaxID=2709310 RepID=A0A6B3R5S7_9FLAO|nr:hypothetical protein [Psychroflexus aurantiacus]NEV93191.1 hypothetical protein [Psychroflexus aurantiacus]
MKGISYIFLILLLSSAGLVNAQDKDFPTRGSEVNNNPKFKSSSSGSGMNRLGIPNRGKVKDFFAKDEKGIDFKPKIQFTNPSDLWTAKLNKNPEDENKGMRAEWAENMSLGDFVTSSDEMTFICRDHMMFDGDRVQIRVNDQIIVDNLLLENAYKEITIPLETGFNKIEFIALNQGEAGPNTAELKIIDGSKLLSRNVWNLLTGVKASTVIVKNE